MQNLVFPPEPIYALVNLKDLTQIDKFYMQGDVHFHPGFDGNHPLHNIEVGSFVRHNDANIHFHQDV